MKFTTSILALFGTLTAAQDLSELPTCAVPCFEDSFDVSGCSSTTDYVCLCGSKNYNQAVVLCVLGACGTADQIASLNWATATCNAVGVPIEI